MIHSKERDASIERSGRVIYNTKRWQMTRKRKLALNPICEQCNNDLATDVHHKHGVANDPWSIEGLEALCHSCHSRVTRAGQVGGGSQA